MIEVKVNSDESYLGKDIREWCMNSDDYNAISVVDNYYTNAKYEPKDDVYYFVDYTSSSESYKICGDPIKLWGCKLRRDLKKSPRESQQKKKDGIIFRDFMNLYDHWNGYIMIHDNRNNNIGTDHISTILGEKMHLLNKTVVSFWFHNGFLAVKLDIN